MNEFSSSKSASPRLDFRNAALYGVISGLSLALFVWLARLAGEQLGWVLGTVLFVCIASASAIIIYVTVRWFVSRRLNAVADAPKQAMAEIRERLSQDASETVTFDDLRQLLLSGLKFLPETYRVVLLVLSALMVINLMASAMLIANAAVMYLQARRLEEQNTLIEQELRVTQAQFLQENLQSQQAIRQQQDVSRNFLASIDDDFLNPFLILPDFVGQFTGARFEKGTLLVCEPGQSCNTLNFQLLIDTMLREGQITATEETAATLAGYVNLTEAMAAIHTLFAASFSDEDGNDIETRLNDVSLACGGETSGRLATLVTALNTGGLAAVDMWPPEAVDGIVAGDVIAPDAEAVQRDFLGVGASMGILAEDAGLELSEVKGAEDAAALVTAALDSVVVELEKLKPLCETTATVLGKTATELQAQARLMLESLASNRTGKLPGN